MQEFVKEIEALKENVSGMIDLISELRQSELQLKQEVGILRTENENLKSQIDFLNEKGKMADLASTVDPESRDEMKLKIRELVREIDGCIALIKS